MKSIVIIGTGKGIGLATVKALSKDHEITAITRSSSEQLEDTGV